MTDHSAEGWTLSRQLAKMAPFGVRDQGFKRLHGAAPQWDCGRQNFTCLEKVSPVHKTVVLVTYCCVTSTPPPQTNGLKQQTFVISQEPKHSLRGHIWCIVSHGVVVKLLARAVVLSRLGWGADNLLPSSLRCPLAGFRGSTSTFTQMVAGMAWFLLVYFVYPGELQSALFLQRARW